MDNQKICNRWYDVKEPIPSDQIERGFWEKVFVEEDEDFVRDTILRYDLDHILKQYLEQRHRVFSRHLQTHPSYVQAHMDCWWYVTCSSKTPNCTRVLQDFFSQSNTALAGPNRLSSRLNDLMEANLWDMALDSMSPSIDRNTAHALLEKIMSNDGEWIQKNQWSSTIEKLSIFLNKGGAFDSQSNKPYQHIFNTTWISDMLVYDKYKNQRTKMLKKLFRLGVHFHDFNMNKFPQAAVDIQLAWDEYSKENLLKTLQNGGNVPIKRKM